MARKKIYKIIFNSQGKVFEIYAKQIVSGEMYGFVEVQGLLFGERTTLVVDPSEEQLKLEFNGVNKTYIPFHTIIRIDEVEKEGAGKIIQINTSDKSTVKLSPLSLVPEKGPEKS
jgi:hypothetical protein